MQDNTARGATAVRAESGDDQLLATRQSLLARLKSREDQASWEEFFNTYWRLIYGTAMKSGLTETEAQDVVQETLLAMVRNIKEFRYDRARCSFKSWLLLITRQRIIWVWRKRPPPAAHSSRTADDPTRTDTLERIADPAGNPLDAIWEEEWQKNLLVAALEQVKLKANPRQYQIFDLAVLQNWPVEEVARTLQLNRAQVYLAKHRLSVRLKDEVRRMEAKVV